VHLAIAGNEPGIGLIRLGPSELGFTKGVDLGRVDHTDEELLLRQKTCQSPSIGARGLHAQVGFPGCVLVQPIDELLVTHGIIGKGFAAILPFRGQEGRIELGLGYIYTDENDRIGHGCLLAKNSGDLRTMPVHPYLCRLMLNADLGYRPNWWQR